MKSRMTTQEKKIRTSEIINSIIEKRVNRASRNVDFAVFDAMSGSKWIGVQVVFRKGSLTADEEIELTNMLKGADLEPAWDYEGQTEYKRLVYHDSGNRPKEEKSYPFRSGMNKSMGLADAFSDTLGVQATRRPKPEETEEEKKKKKS